MSVFNVALASATVFVVVGIFILKLKQRKQSSTSLPQINRNECTIINSQMSTSSCDKLKFESSTFLFQQSPVRNLFQANDKCDSHSSLNLNANNNNNGPNDRISNRSLSFEASLCDDSDFVEIQL